MSSTEHSAGKSGIRDALASSRLRKARAPRIPRALELNIQQLLARHEDRIRHRSLQERISDTITDFSGSMAFVWLHVAWFGVWIALNVVMTSTGFDPFPFGLLTMLVGLEAIFLSTFVLLSQNKMQAVADQRAELDLHINLLAERESTLILTKLVRLERHLGIAVPEDEVRLAGELIEPIDAVEVLAELERRDGRGGGAAR